MLLTRSASLLFLGVVVAALYAEAQDVCTLSASSNMEQPSPFNLTVSPGNLTSASEYTVTLSSRENASVQVLFQAMANGVAMGNWSITNTSSNCTEGFGVSRTVSETTSLVATWTSPSNLSVNSVNISALVNNQSSVYLAQRTLNDNTVSSTAAPNVTMSANTTMSPNTTMASNTTMSSNSTMASNTTMSSNSTMASNSTTATTTKITTKVTVAPVTKQTSGGHTNNPASLLFTLCLLVITTKLLS
ncbi:placenta-expressed transcript 1 protein-like [Eleutherodactylus coqui]|uniref:Reelin domain-containing protein n=1 Tax=Eleutherodactylus coqui TaxID=57060 RepID=A0A8J6JK25_ELECQ|nr:hypothetical protein GDO78_015195 [Eleutherodactylus coqui]